MSYISTKTYGHDVGLSVAFRQWRADSHCRFLHGYALGIRLEFIADNLDDRNWVVDFGGLKSFKQWIKDTFDHKTLVAYDDPKRPWFERAAEEGLLDLAFVDATGCEAFAFGIYNMAEHWLKENGYYPRCKIHRVEVKEHGANSAIYQRGLSCTAQSTQ